MSFTLNKGGIFMELRKIVLIPAYQPQQEMIDMIHTLKEAGFYVVLVDDGSGEEYQSIFKMASLMAIVLTHSENCGKGAALKTGLEYIGDTVAAPYVVITADADGQHKPEDIRSVCHEAIEHPGTLILGSRQFDKDVPLRSKFGNAVTRAVFHLSSGQHVYDTQTGLRAFTDELVEPLLAIDGDRYEYEMNVLMRFSEDGIPMEEVPIETVYLNNNESSHFNTVRDSARIYKEIIKFSLSSLISFGIDYLLFCLLTVVSGSLLIANIGARIVSGGVNYTLNKKMVFRHEKKIASSLLQYIALAGCILVLNTLLLEALAYINVNVFFAKIMAELLLFSFNYFIQHAVIFRGKGVVNA